MKDLHIPVLPDDDSLVIITPVSEDHPTNQSWYGHWNFFSPSCFVTESTRKFVGLFDSSISQCLSSATHSLAPGTLTSWPGFDTWAK